MNSTVRTPRTLPLHIAVVALLVLTACAADEEAKTPVAFSEVSAVFDAAG